MGEPIIISGEPSGTARSGVVCTDEIIRDNE